MKRVITVLLISLAVVLPVLLVRHHTSAIDLLGPSCRNADRNNLPPACQDSQQLPSNANPLYGPHGVLTTVVNILSIITAVIAIIVLMAAGVKMIVSSGDSNTIASARRTIIYAVISLFIVATAQLAVRFLLSRINVG